MSLSDKIWEKDSGLEQDWNLDVEDVKEAVKELRLKTCICFIESDELCLFCTRIKEIFGEKLI